MPVEIWWDVVSPFGCVGKRRFAAALAAFAHRGAPRVNWRSFDRDAEASSVPTGARHDAALAAGGTAAACPT